MLPAELQCSSSLTDRHLFLETKEEIPLPGQILYCIPTGNRQKADGHPGWEKRGQRMLEKRRTKGRREPRGTAEETLQQGLCPFSQEKLKVREARLCPAP